MTIQHAQQPGAVVRHVVHVGDVVTAGDPVVVVETMKFESVIAAEGPGVVAELTPIGEIVAVGTPLCDIRRPGGDG